MAVLRLQAHRIQKMSEVLRKSALKLSDGVNIKMRPRNVSKVSSGQSLITANWIICMTLHVNRSHSRCVVVDSFIFSSDIVTVSLI